MRGSTTKRSALLALAATGLFSVLASSASADAVAEAAKTPKAKANVSQVSTAFPLPSTAGTDRADASATCGRGTTLLSGGALSNTPAPAGPPSLETTIYMSGPVENAWFVRYDGSAPVNLMPSVQAICLKNRLRVVGTEGKPRAISKVTQVNVPFTLPPDANDVNSAQVDVVCPEGTKVVGGGASFTATAVGTDILLQESGPQGNGWHVRYENDELGVAQTAIASALCLKGKLKVKKLPGKGKARSSLEQIDQGVSLPPSGTNSGRARFTVACPEGTKVVGGGGAGSVRRRRASSTSRSRARSATAGRSSSTTTSPAPSRRRFTRSA